jgi:hypothetical protein
MDGIGVVGALEGVVAAVGEGFLAAGPADVVFCGGVFEFGFCCTCQRMFERSKDDCQVGCTTSLT